MEAPCQGPLLMMHHEWSPQLGAKLRRSISQRMRDVGALINRIGFLGVPYYDYSMKYTQTLY